MQETAETLLKCAGVVSEIETDVIDNLQDGIEDEETLKAAVGRYMV